MGATKSERPERLAEKLRQIRLKLGLSQTGMAEALSKHGVRMYRGYVGSYENEDRLPSYLVLLAYAEIAGVSTDKLINDKLDLPVKYK